MKIKRLLLVLFLFVVILTITACNNVRVITGSGDLITETRSVSNFDRIDLSGSGEVILTQDGSESLTIETDDNVMEYVKAEVEDGALKLGFETGIITGVNVQSMSRLIFNVSVDNLSGLVISGSGNVEADKLDTDRLDISVNGSGDVQITALTASKVKASISGSGEINLQGEVSSQEVEIGGSGKYLAGDVCSVSVKVSIGGSGDATVCATETLDANVSGSGTVNYYGQPSFVNTSSSGSGKINNRGEK